MTFFPLQTTLSDDQISGKLNIELPSNSQVSHFRIFMTVHCSFLVF